MDLQNWIAVHQPVDPLVDFVHRPLYTVTGDPTVTAAVDRHLVFRVLQAVCRYREAISNALDNNPTKVAPGDYGPVPAMTTALLRLS